MSSQWERSFSNFQYLFPLYENQEQILHVRIPLVSICRKASFNLSLVGSKNGEDLGTGQRGAPARRDWESFERKYSAKKVQQSFSQTRIGLQRCKRWLKQSLQPGRWSSRQTWKKKRNLSNLFIFLQKADDDGKKSEKLIQIKKHLKISLHGSNIKWCN